jgi:signal transduction histidine kinase
MRDLAINREIVGNGAVQSTPVLLKFGRLVPIPLPMRVVGEQLPAERRPEHETRRPVAEDPLAAAAADGALRERARMRAWLHDSVLQTLEYIAAGGYADEPDPVALAASAASAADQLRAEIEGELPPAAGPLMEEIHALVERERQTATYRIDLEIGVIEPDFKQAGAEPLLAAVGEALRNAGKHADAGRVRVSCDVAGGIATAIVEDDGVGFDPGAVRRGAGLRHSIVGRLEHEGGRAVIESGCGRGTRVVMQLGLAPRLASPSRDAR